MECEKAPAVGTACSLDNLGTIAQKPRLGVFSASELNKFASYHTSTVSVDIISNNQTPIGYLGEDSRSTGG